jgi:DNA-binding GntR family transcriptional regulator
MSTLQQEVYETIRHRLLSGGYRSGQKLVEKKLASELGVNRNPVREALLKLTGEGLLERQAGVGCRVAKQGIDLLCDAWQLRESVEGMAARIAATRMTEAGLLRLQHEHELMQRLTGPSMDEALAASDDRFHRQIVESSGNQALHEVWQQYLTRIIATQVALIPQYRAASVYSEMFEQHQAILDALIARDPDTAERAIRVHIASGREQLMRAMSVHSKTDSKRGEHVGVGIG